MGPFLERTLWGNPTLAWAAGLGVALATFGGALLARALGVRWLAARAERTPTPLDEAALVFLRSTRPLLILALSLWAGTLVLELPPRAASILHKLAAVALLAQGTLSAHALIVFWMGVSRRRKEKVDPAAVTTLSVMGLFLQAVLWAVAAVLFLDNLGVNVTALVTGLGIGGVAVALAAQNILSDLFASLAIILDRPFAIGDLIAVGDAVGTVETIGMKTTRLRSPGGEILVYSNAELLRNRIRNFRGGSQRRVEFAVGVPLDTPHATAARIPGILREAIESHPNARFIGAHLRELGEGSLAFGVAYTIPGLDPAAVAEAQHAVHLAILRRFQEEQIPFARPSRAAFVPQGVAPVKW